MESKFKNEIYRNNIIKEINLIRSKPAEYIKIIESYIKYFSGKILMFPDAPGFMTNEGVSAYKEAISFLEKSKTYSPIKYSPGLSHIAHDYNKNLEFSEDIDLEESSIYIEKILKKYDNIININDIKYFSSFCSYSPQLFVINLAVCDGDKKRKFRETLFSDDYNYVGLATGYNFLYNDVTTVIFSHDFNEKEYTEKGSKRSTIIKIPLETIDEYNYNFDILNPIFKLSPHIKKIEREDKIIRDRGKRIMVTKIILYTKEGRVIKRKFRHLVENQ